MTSTPTDDRPACTSCHRPLWHTETGRYLCQPCEDMTAKQLRELPGAFAKLLRPDALTRPSHGTTAPVSGSRTPPIPPRLDALDLVGPGGAAARLAAIEDAWRQALGWTVAPWRGSPAQAVPEHVKFLTTNLLWAAWSYDSVDQDVTTIRTLTAELDAATSADRQPGRAKIGLCPVLLDDDQPCATQLYATTAEPAIKCRGCRTVWPDPSAWRELRYAQSLAFDHVAA